MGPLAGVKVIEFSHWLVGPYCANMLSDLGAEVIKVEPITGDQVRSSGSYFKDGESYLFAAYNHGKQSISINLKDPEGLSIARDLCRDADVVLENYRPGTCDRLGLGYESLKRQNSRLIYCSISAFGDTPEYVHRPGMDPIIQGMGAAMSVTGEPGGNPLLAGIPVADNSTAYMAFGAICSALFQRERTGHGQRIELSLIDTMLFNLSTRFGQYIASGKSPSAMGSQHAEVVPYQAFPTADGWLMAGAQSDQAWAVFCQSIGREELTDHPDFRTNPLRVKHRQVLSELLNNTFGQKTTADWCSILQQYNVLHGPIWNVEQFVNSDLIRDHGIIETVQHAVFGQLPIIKTPITFSDSQVEIQGPPPILGEHTLSILRRLGRDEQAISDLITRNVVYAKSDTSCESTVDNLGSDTA